MRRHRAVGVDAVQHPGCPALGRPLEHASHPETAGRVDPSVVESVAGGRRLHGDPGLERLRRPVEPSELVFDRNQQSPRFIGERDRAGATRQIPMGLRPGSRFQAEELSAVDVDPVQG